MQSLWRHTRTIKAGCHIQSLDRGRSTVMSEIEALKKENTEITRQFRHLLSKSKYLLRIVNNFKRENERLKKDNQLLRLELLNLQNHCKDLAHEIAIQCNHSKSVLNHRQGKFFDYLLKRNKTGIRPRSLNKHQ